MNKKKIFNDPVYGFVAVPTDLIFDIIEHPFFQKLRRIKQLGLTDFVYPGALHTRFHHAIGAMHLMSITLDNLRSKGNEISQEEYEAALIAILLHDIGHGPFSHTLEYCLLKGIKHEDISFLVIKHLNKHFGGALDLAIRMFCDQYERKFFHQLVSSQLDIDRLDYLNRDSFFTGVSEGTIGADRIIKMLDVRDDQIVVEEKGIYSIENFLSARRLMYWQVYLHKTTISSEKILVKLITRAKDLISNQEPLFSTKPLKLFLENEITLEDFENNDAYLTAFCSLDDYDIWAAIKIWSQGEDKVLRLLANMILNRRLFKVVLSNDQIQDEKIKEKQTRIIQKLNLNEKESEYFIAHGSMSNSAYISEGQSINILTKNGKILDVAQASDLPNIKAMSKIVKKYYLCWAKSLSL
ncbi:HD domain-containing protein [Fulvivirgaceae bacterium BMA10]|uniref:HD domain-containing protein n=1 Tax=Splendidivirga corallicola TaxID=3051826 RepID=A0ABT8KRF9_9BACT|nr:HD domain-containing protein [Fulvivirgaceae bacterium BMA10]